MENITSISRHLYTIMEQAKIHQNSPYLVYQDLNKAMTLIDELHSQIMAEQIRIES